MAFQSQRATEPDGVRILDYYRSSHSINQILVSTKPILSPEAIIRSIEGRLQYIIQEESPKAFQRNYSMKSVGTPKKDAVNKYIESQLTHHPFADERVTRRFANYQIVNSGVDLSPPHRSSYGEYCCNLHIVLVNNDRWREIDDGLISTLREMNIRAAEKKGHLI